jgi:hypothetical protein
MRSDTTPRVRPLRIQIKPRNASGCHKERCWLANRCHKKTPNLTQMILGWQLTRRWKRDAESETKIKQIEASGRHVQRLWQSDVERRDANCPEATKNIFSGNNPRDAIWQDNGKSTPSITTHSFATSTTNCKWSQRKHRDAIRPMLTNGRRASRRR